MRNQFYVKKFSAFVDLPVQHCNNLTKLMSKLQQVEFGKTFKTMLDKQGKRFLFMRLDYNHAGVHFDRKLDALDELILNSIYSFGFGLSTDNEGYYSLKEERPIFGARKILQHIFGNVADHFQEEIVKVVEERLEDMSYMKLTFDLRDNLGNSEFLTVRGEKYRPVAVKESLLDVSVVQFESQSQRRFPIYRLNRKSPVFIFAEKLGQITSWDTRCMAVPCQKTIQNAVIASYLLTRISLVKNVKNHYVNNGILFNTLFEDLRLDVSTRMKRKVIRDNIRRMFDYWVQIGLLMSYEFVKVGQKFHKIEFKVNLAEAGECSEKKSTTYTRTPKSTSREKPAKAATSAQSAKTAPARMARASNSSRGSLSAINVSSAERVET